MLASRTCRIQPVRSWRPRDFWPAGRCEPPWSQSNAGTPRSPPFGISRPVYASPAAAASRGIPNTPGTDSFGSAHTSTPTQQNNQMEPNSTWLHWSRVHLALIFRNLKSSLLMMEFRIIHYPMQSQLGFQKDTSLPRKLVCKLFSVEKTGPYNFVLSKRKIKMSIRS